MLRNKLRIARQLLPVIALSIGATGIALGAEAAKDIYKGSTEERLDALAAVQPGLGTVMAEYGNRFTNAYFAAKGGNWRLAQYQIKEMTEIQEVGEATRPSKADALKGFEEGNLAPLELAIKNKDFSTFKGAFEEAAAGCNGCHAGTGNPFVKYVLPHAPVEAYLDFNLKTDPK
jgi:hypothetical protein